jgi:hypothetical protein
MNSEQIDRGLPKGTTVGYYIGGMKEGGASMAQVPLGTYSGFEYDGDGQSS